MCLSFLCSDDILSSRARGVDPPQRIYTDHIQGNCIIWKGNSRLGNEYRTSYIPRTVRYTVPTISQGQEQKKKERHGGPDHLRKRHSSHVQHAFETSRVFRARLLRVGVWWLHAYLPLLQSFTRHIDGTLPGGILRVPVS